MKVNISYKLSALHEAAKYIWENNIYVKVWPGQPQSPIDVMQGMKEMMIKHALENAHIVIQEKKTGVASSKWGDYTGTGGYYFLFSLLDEPETADSDITVEVDILVDPSIRYDSEDKVYRTEVIDEIV